MEKVTFEDRKKNMVIPYLLVENIEEFIDFVKKTFNGQLNYKLSTHTEQVLRAEIEIGNSVIMVGESKDELGVIPWSLYIYVEDCDTIYENALAYGCESIMPLTNRKHLGERYGGVRDKYGNLWWIATLVEDLSPEERERRLQNQLADAAFS